MTSKLLKGKNVYNAAQDISDTWTSQELKVCEHALYILKIIGAETFIRDVPSFEVQYRDLSIEQYRDYIEKNEEDIREVINDYKTNVVKLGNAVTKAAFGIKLTETPTGFNVINMWVLNKHNGIWPYNKNNEEELKVLIPEVIVTRKDKIQMWAANKTKLIMPVICSKQDNHHASIVNDMQLLPPLQGINCVNVRIQAKGIVNIPYKR